MSKIKNTAAVRAIHPAMIKKSNPIVRVREDYVDAHQIDEVGDRSITTADGTIVSFELLASIFEQLTMFKGNLMVRDMLGTRTSLAADNVAVEHVASTFRETGRILRILDESGK